MSSIQFLHNLVDFVDGVHCLVPLLSVKSAITQGRFSGMTSQYYPVIFQIGTRLIQAGFAGDAYPIVRKFTSDYQLSPNVINTSTSHAIPQDDVSMQNDTMESSHYNVLWSYDLISNDISHLENVLEMIIWDIYTNYLLVDAKRCKVLIIEPPFFPKPLKQLISRVFLFHMHSQSISFFPEPIMSCVSTGSHSGIVINLGWSQTLITPVSDLRMIYKDIRVTNKSGKLVHENILKRLQVLGKVPKNSFEFIERLITETSFCKLESSREEKDENMFSFEGVEVPNTIRYEPIEDILFGDDDSNDDDNQGIVSLTVSLLKDLNIDLRSDLPKKIIFTGGISNIPGVKARFLQEIRKAGAFTFSTDSIVPLGPWEGASLYCSTALMSPSSTGGSQFKNSELQRDKYLSGEGHLVDWTDQLYLK